MTCEEIEQAISMVEAELDQLLIVQQQTSDLLNAGQQLLNDLLLEYEGCSSEQLSKQPVVSEFHKRHFNAYLKRWRKTINGIDAFYGVDQPEC